MAMLAIRSKPSIGCRLSPIKNAIFNFLCHNGANVGQFWIRNIKHVSSISFGCKKDAYISILNMYSIGIGPSSSHTLGPMKAAKRFITSLEANGMLGMIQSLFVHLYGSLALTGDGHGTPKAVVVSLAYFSHY